MGHRDPTRLIGNKFIGSRPESNIPEVTELDELQTFVGSKKTNSGYGLL
jgi:hypothetical protein